MVRNEIDLWHGHPGRVFPNHRQDADATKAVPPGATTENVLVGLLVGVAIIICVVAVWRLDVTGESGSGLGKQFTYDIKDMAKIDPNLILYEESGRPISTGFAGSSAIVVGPEGSLYVAGDKAVHMFGETGNLVGKVQLTDKPRSLAVSQAGEIYIGMRNHVEVYERQGNQLATWDSLGEKAVLTSIAVSKNDVFVADAGNRIVLHYDTAGKLINRIGAKDEDRNIPGFVIRSPYFDLAVARDGLLRVVNPGRHRIEAYTFDGDLEFYWGQFSRSVEGFCGCCNPVNFAILEDESFVTCEKGLIRVKIYDVEGVFAGVVAGPEQLIEGGAAAVCEFPAQGQAVGFDIAVDAKGRVFVLDTVKNLVRVYSRKKAG